MKLKQNIPIQRFNSRKDFLTSAPCAQTLTRHFLLCLLKLVAKVSGMKGKRDHISEEESGSLDGEGEEPRHKARQKETVSKKLNIHTCLAVIF